MFAADRYTVKRDECNEITDELRTYPDDRRPTRFLKVDGHDDASLSPLRVMSFGWNQI